MARGKGKILLPAFVVEMLKQHRVQQLEAWLKVGSMWEDRDLVFTNLRGGYFNPRYLEKLFRRSFFRIGVSRFRRQRLNRLSRFIHIGTAKLGLG